MALWTGSPEDRARAARARKNIKARMKHSADKWVPLMKSFNPDTGMEQQLIYNVETGEIAGRRINHYRDQLIAQNRAEHADSLNRRFRDMTKVASIPMDVFMDELQPAYEARDERYVRRFLNDPDNAAFRTFRGNL